jgi:hypothetical protein
MSHRRAKDRNFHAFFATAATCLLAIALIASNFVYGARAAASARHGYTGAAISCHQDQASAATPRETPARGGGHSNSFGCPDCCLAGLAGAAVLPQRDASCADLTRIASAAVYFALSPSGSEHSISSAVNGARAPPAA